MESDESSSLPFSANGISTGKRFCRLRVAVLMKTFSRPELKDQQLVEVTVAAVQRATGSNLGSICLSSLIVAVARMVGKTALTARRVGLRLGARIGVLR